MQRVIPTWVWQCFTAVPEEDVNDTLTRAAGLLSHEPPQASRARLGSPVNIVDIAAVSVVQVDFPDEVEVQGLMNLVSALCPIVLDDHQYPEQDSAGLGVDMQMEEDGEEDEEEEEEDEEDEEEDEVEEDSVECDWADELRARQDAAEDELMEALTAGPDTLQNDPGSDSQNVQAARNLRDGVPVTGASPPKPTMVPRPAPRALRERCTLLPVKDTATPAHAQSSTDGTREVFVIGWGRFMEKMGLGRGPPYIDGKIMHPECGSSNRNMNRCRQDTLERADLTIQDYLRANGVTKADTYTPFMDYRSHVCERENERERTGER